MAFPKHQYEPLPNHPEKHAIRLLALPVNYADTGRPLDCHLRTVFLEDAPDYEALSYCWGSTKLEKHIICDGMHLPITQNLEAALRELAYRPMPDRYSGEEVRSEGNRRMFWIDAICIDQANVEERSSQVDLMLPIFRQAKKTVVWLGDNRGSAGSSGRDLLKVMREVRFELDRHGKLYRSGYYFDGSIEELNWLELLPRIYIGDKAELQLEIDAFQRMISEPWFDRAWIVQEFAVASKVEVCYGRLKLDWSDITEAARAFNRFDMTGLGVARDLTFRPVLLDGMRNRFTFGTTQDMLELLKVLRHRQATDKRDLIYSLLGLATDASSLGIKADYRTSITTAGLFIEVARAILKHQSALFLLEVPKPPVDENLGMVLPSWVPDWSFNPFTRPLTDPNSPHFCAGGRSDFWFGFHPENGLALKGSTFRLKRLGPKWPREQKDISTGMTAEEVLDMLEKMKEWETFATEQADVKAYPATEEALLDVYWQTLLAGRGAGSDAQRKAFFEWRERLRRGRRDLKSRLQPSASPLRQWARRLSVRRDARADAEQQYFTRWDEQHFALGRRLAWSADDRLSLVPEATRDGDVLFFAQGCRLPLVLSHVRDTDYLLVGAAYTHGRMEGELWDWNIDKALEDVVLK